MSVYFVKCNEFVKIGYSSNPMQRVVQLQIGSPYSQELLALMPGDITTEGELHGIFSSYRHSNEWFRLEGDLLSFINDMTRIFSEYTKRMKKDSNYLTNDKNWKYWKERAINAESELKQSAKSVKTLAKYDSVYTEMLECPECGKEVKGVKGLNGHKAWCENKKIPIQMNGYQK